MKFFTNKSIWSKIIIVLIFILVFEFIVAKPTLADNEGVNTGIEFAGKLMSPILSLVVTLADAAMEISQSSIMGTDESLLEADLSSAWYDVLGFIFKAAIVVGLFVFAPWATTIALIANTIISASVGVDILGTIGDRLYDTGMEAIGVSSVQTSSFIEANLPETLYLPAYSLTPEEIFKGNILMFNVDFFGEPKTITPHTVDITDENGNVTGQEVDYYYYTDDNGNEVKTSKQDMGAQLSGTISRWYVSIRNIALVCMMIVLLYIGIRMLLSTLSTDKAKYRQMLQDWLVGLLLLFLMHYIMAFSVTLVQKLTDIVSTSVDSNRYMVIIPNDSNNKLRDFIKDSGMQDYIVDSSGNPNPDADGTDAYIYYPTDMMGYLRLTLQLSNWGSEYVGLSICFLVLVLFTIFFVFTYLRRVLYMAFLTLIAPVVAITYPIDKINDGSAQGFSKWFKEYIFNLLIQPMHLLLYFVLITSAYQLASTNVIYSLVAIGFMIPAEKILRNLFGFEKASTAGALNGVAGGALAMAGINKLAHIGHGRGGAYEGSGSSKSVGSSSDDKPRMNGNVDKEANMMAIAGVDDDDDDDDDNQGVNASNSNNSNNSLPSDRKEQLQSLKDDLEAEGLSPGDSEYEQMVRERGFTPEDLQNLDDKESNKTIEIPRIEEADVEEAEEDSSGKESNILGKMGRQVGRVAKAGGAVSVNRVKRELKNGVKSMPRTALKLAGGSFTGAAGVAAGIATGDPSNVLSYGAAGAAAGAAGVSALANSARLTPEDKRVWKEVYNGPEYEDLERERYRKKFIKEHKDQLGRNFSKEKVAEMTKKGGMVEKMLDNGIDDIDDIITGGKMMESGKVKNVDEAVTVTSFAREVKDNYKGPNREKWEKATSKRYQENVGLSKDKADKVAKTSMDMTEQFYKAKKNIHK